MKSLTRRMAPAWLIAAGLIVGGGAARAEHSNRNDVRADLEKDGWTVVWGKNFTEGDWIQGSEAIGESIVQENPGPFLRWFGQVMEENFNKIERNLQVATRQDVERWILQSLKEKAIITYNGFEIQAGFATYSRWERVVYDEPRTGQRRVRLYPGGPWTYVPYVYTERVEKEIPLPNWHQFYIRYKLLRANNNPPQGGGQGLGNRFVTRCGSVLERVGGDVYELRFDSGELARYRHVGGQVFVLAQPGSGPYNIDRLVISNSQLGKHYQGEREPTFHDGWEGRWE